MAIVSKFGKWTDDDFRPLEQSSVWCFYCGDALDSLSIQWEGWTPRANNGATFRGNEIILHPGCVVELTIRLLRDVHEWECLGNRVSTSGTGTE